MTYRSFSWSSPFYTKQLASISRLRVLAAFFSWLGDIMWHHISGPSLVPVVVCWHFAVKLLSGPMLLHHQFNLTKNIQKFWSNYNNFHSRKCTWKCLWHDGQSVQARKDSGFALKWNQHFYTNFPGRTPWFPKISWVPEPHFKNSMLKPWDWQAFDIPPSFSLPSDWLTPTWHPHSWRRPGPSPWAVYHRVHTVVRWSPHRTGCASPWCESILLQEDSQAALGPHTTWHPHVHPVMIIGTHQLLIYHFIDFIHRLFIANYLCHILYLITTG